MNTLSSRAVARARSKHLSPGLAFGINGLADKLALADKLIISPRPCTQVSNEAAIRNLADAIGDSFQFHNGLHKAINNAAILTLDHHVSCTPKVCTRCGGAGHTAAYCPWTNHARRMRHVASR